MPGTNAGTGVPISFKCWNERREYSEGRTYLRIEHRVRRTGREKPYRPKGQTIPRQDHTSREYVCSCGHRGWSCLKELQKYPLEGEKEAERLAVAYNPNDDRERAEEGLRAAPDRSRIPPAQRAG